MHPWQRLTTLALAVVCVVAMGVHYDTEYVDRWPYPTSDELAADYEAHVGQEVFLFGTVTSASDETAQVRVDAAAGAYTLTVRSFDATVPPGGTVQLLGEVRPDGVLVAHRVAVVNPSSTSESYKYAVSAVGAGLVAVVFRRHWRVNTETLALEPRDG